MTLSIKRRVAAGIAAGLLIAACTDLTETTLPAGHWLPLECKEEHIAAIRTWLRKKKL